MKVQKDIYQFDGERKRKPIKIPLFPIPDLGIAPCG